MAKTRQYSRGRRTWLQVMLALVLIAVTALAAMICRVRSAGRQVVLGSSQRIGNLVAQMPRDWALGNVGASGEAVEFREPSPTLKGRTIIIRQRVQNSPRLSAGGLLAAELQAGPEMRPEPFTLLGQPGILAEMGPYETQFGERVEPGIYAATVFPDGFAVSIRITSPEILGPSNRRLLRQITENMALAAFQCRPEHSTDRISVLTAGKTATVEILSATGIGRATMRPLGDSGWPDTITIRLKKMDRLEGFIVRAGSLEIRSSLGQEDVQLLRRFPDGGTADLPTDANYAMGIHADGLDIVATLPRILWTTDDPAGVREIGFQWVNAYRQ